MNQLLRQVALILRNDLRISWRELRSHQVRSSIAAGFAVLLFVVAQLVAWFLCSQLRQSPSIATEGALWLFFASVMMGVAVHQSIALLYVRSDLDLLLGSPVPPRAILIARLIAITGLAGLTVALFVVPLINAAAATLSLHYLAGYAVAGLLALLAAAAGLALALLLVRLFGERRGRTVAQVTGALLGASIYLLTQAPNWFPNSARPVIAAQLQRMAAWPVVTFPARAGRGDPVMLGMLALTAFAATLLAARALDGMLLRGVQNAGAHPARRRRVRAVETWSPAPLVVAVRKDVRLIVRDPLLLSQVLPSVIYILPAALALAGRLGWSVLGVISVLVSGQFAGLLTRVAADGEECWDLIRMSPAAEQRQRIAKMLAGLAVPVGVATALSAGLLVSGRPAHALLAWLTAALVAAGCARIQVAVIRPTPRSDLMKRRKGSFTPLQLVAGLLILLGTTGVAFAASGWWIVAGAVLAVTAVVVALCFVLVRFAETRFPAA